MMLFFANTRFRPSSCPGNAINKARLVHTLDIYVWAGSSTCNRFSRRGTRPGPLSRAPHCLVLEMVVDARISHHSIFRGECVEFLHFLLPRPPVQSEGKGGIEVKLANLKRGGTFLWISCPGRLKLVRRVPCWMSDICSKPCSGRLLADRNTVECAVIHSEGWGLV